MQITNPRLPNATRASLLFSNTQKPHHFPALLGETATLLQSAYERTSAAKHGSAPQTIPLQQIPASSALFNHVLKLATAEQVPAI